VIQEWILYFFRDGEEVLIEFLVALSLKEQVFDHVSMIVELGEVTNHNTNYARPKAVDATNKTQLIHPVSSCDFCFLLEGVYFYYHFQQG